MAHDIVETAIALIERYGIEKLSLRHAATICGVSPSAVYRHFSSKEKLLIACATEGYQLLANAMDTRASKVSEHLNQLGFGYLTFAYQHPKLFTFMFNADLSEASEEQLAVFRKSYQLLLDVAKRGVDEGIFIGSVEVVTAKAWSLVHGLASLVIANRIPASNIEEYLTLAQNIFAGELERKL